MQAGYMGVPAPDTRHRVADAWTANRPAKGSHYDTDGQTITSYDWHITAITLVGVGDVERNRQIDQLADQRAVETLAGVRDDYTMAIDRLQIQQGRTVKVAFDCHYSPTTAKQTGPAKAAADVVIPCVTCYLNHKRSLSSPTLEAVKAEAIRIMYEHPQAVSHPQVKS